MHTVRDKAGRRPARGEPSPGRQARAPRGGARTRGRRPDVETRERLRAAAKTLFGQRGFNKVSVREICNAAGANVAAINYHFGDKLGLYLTLVEEAVKEMRESNRLVEEAGRGLPAEARLRAFVDVFLARVAGGDDDERSGWIGQVMARELEDPTPALEVVYQQVIRPRMTYVGQAIAEIIGCSPTDSRVKRCFASLQAQFFVLRKHVLRDRLLGIDPGEFNVKEMATHIAEFSLAGIRALARPRAHTSQKGSGRR